MQTQLQSPTTCEFTLSKDIGKYTRVVFTESSRQRIFVVDDSLFSCGHLTENTYEHNPSCSSEEWDTHPSGYLIDEISGDTLRVRRKARMSGSFEEVELKSEDSLSVHYAWIDSGSLLLLEFFSPEEMPKIAQNASITCASCLFSWRCSLLFGGGVCKRVP